MQEYINHVMEEVAKEILVIRQVCDGAIEAQKQSFELELGKVKGKVEQLESEIKALKTVKQLLGSKPLLAQKTPADKAIPRSTSNGQTGKNQVENREESPEPQKTSSQKINAGPPEESQLRTERRDYASVAASQPAKVPDQLWTKVSYGTRKTGKQSSTTAKQEQRG